jgi:hypothetical protein
MGVCGLQHQQRGVQDVAPRGEGLQACKRPLRLLPCCSFGGIGLLGFNGQLVKSLLQALQQ